MAERLKRKDAEWSNDDETLRVWFRLTDYPDVRLLAVATAEDGRLYLRRLEVDGDDLNSAALRAVANSVSDIRAAIRTEARAHGQTFGLLPLYRAADQPTGERPADEAYAMWAKRYVEACDRGHKNPVAFVAAKYKRDAKHVRNQLQKARERGLLTTEGPGRIGGDLSPRAVELLARRKGKR